MEQNTTRNRIHTAAIEEFRSKGFLAASLRNIVKTAGVTTGAFYGYYSSKEELFASIVGPHADALMGMYQEAVDHFMSMDIDEQKLHTGEIGEECMQRMICHCYDNLPECQLLFSNAQGTKYEHFMHELVEKEIEYTRRFEQRLGGRNCPSTILDERFDHIITSGMFAAMIEPVIHEVPREDALLYIKRIHEFYTAGWKHLMGIDHSL